MRRGFRSTAEVKPYMTLHFFYLNVSIVHNYLRFLTGKPLRKEGGFIFSDISNTS